jgi:hypothetical protein
VYKLARVKYSGAHEPYASPFWPAVGWNFSTVVPGGRDQTTSPDFNL